MATDKERLMALETGLKEHLKSCTRSYQENKEDHKDIKNAVMSFANDFKKDIRQLFGRIWWMVGVIITGCASIIVAMYQAIGG